MTFLVWDNQTNANTSLANINNAYGLPYKAENGYRMDTWDVVMESVNENAWGFFKPEELLSMEMDDLMSNLIAGYNELDDRPANFFLDDGEDN